MSYYRGDYYRGDPFSLGGILGGIGKTIGGVVGGLATGGPLGGIVGGIAGLATAVGGGGGSPAIIPPAPVMPGGSPTFAGLVAGPGPGVQQPGFGIGGTRIIPGNLLPGGSPGIVQNVQNPLKGYHINKSALKGKPFKRYLVKNQQMNVANSRALRRAIRRGRGFVKLARRAAGAFGFKVVSKGHGVRKGARRR